MTFNGFTLGQCRHLAAARTTVADVRISRKFKHIGGGHEVASSRACVEIFLALTQAERNALKAVASGMVGTVSILQLGKLRSLDLVHHDGSKIALTANGGAVVALVDGARGDN